MGSRIEAKGGGGASRTQMGSHNEWGKRRGRTARALQETCGHSDTHILMNNTSQYYQCVHTQILGDVVLVYQYRYLALADPGALDARPGFH